MNTDIITLDLRGTKITTLRSTFRRLIKIEAIENGANDYFIDQNPKYFHIILDYARRGECPPEKEWPVPPHEKEYFRDTLVACGMLGSFEECVAEISQMAFEK